MTNTTHQASVLPSLHSDGGLSHYLEEIRQFPMLQQREEYMLAKAWKEHGDRASAHRLVTSHLRLVAKIAMGYRGYGLPVNELIAEGNIGLMQAVKRFDPERGFRLATYAMWWIKASIQEYILHSWSLVKIGTTAAQKKLFFNLRKLKGKMQAYEEGDLSAEQVKVISDKLAVTPTEVIEMNRRMAGGDASLNAPRGLEDEGSEWQDWLADDKANQEQILASSQERAQQQQWLAKAFAVLNERERKILVARRLAEPSLTLEQLAQQLDISRERVRQIEQRAFEKMQQALALEINLAKSQQLLPAPKETASIASAMAASSKERPKDRVEPAF